MAALEQLMAAEQQMGTPGTPATSYGAYGGCTPSLGNLGMLRSWADFQFNETSSFDDLRPPFAFLGH